jgi:hypothetical protein
LAISIESAGSLTIQRIGVPSETHDYYLMVNGKLQKIIYFTTRKVITTNNDHYQRESLDGLSNAFGTRKRIKLLKAKDDTKLTVRQDINDVLVQNIVLPDLGAIHSQRLENRIIPPDMSAASIENVYHIPSLLPLVDVVKLFFWDLRTVDDVRAALVGLQITPWTWSRLENVLHERNDKQKCRRIIFLAYLMLFYRIGIRQLNDDFMVKLAGLRISSFLKDTFCVSDQDKKKRLFLLTKSSCYSCPARQASRIHCFVSPFNQQLSA